MQALGVDIQTIQSIVGHADTEMTEHYLHVQESIRQSAIQLFSEAFPAWKLDGTALIRPDKIFGIVVKIVVKTKWGQPINKKIQRFLTWNRWIYGPPDTFSLEQFYSLRHHQFFLYASFKPYFFSYIVSAALYSISKNCPAVGRWSSGYPANTCTFSRSVFHASFAVLRTALSTALQAWPEASATGR